MRKFYDTLSYLQVKSGLNVANNRFDKLYASIKDPGLGDQIDYYKYKQRVYYESVHWDYNKVDPKLLISYPDSILNLIERNKAEKIYQSQYADANFLKGDALYYAMHRYKDALKYYFIGKNISNQLTNEHDKANFTQRFGESNFEEGKFRKAASLFMLEFRQRTSQLDEMNADVFGSIEHALNDAAFSYNQLGMSDSALYCLNLTNWYIQKYGSKLPAHKRFILDVTGVTDGYMGVAYNNKNENEKAERYLKLSIAINSHGGNEAIFAQRMQLVLARLYLTTGRAKLADSTAAAIRKSLDTIPNNSVEMGWQKLKADYFYFFGKTGEAQRYSAAYLKLKNSIDSVKPITLGDDIENYFNSIQQEYNANLLKKQKQLNSLQLTIFIGCILFILVVAFQLWNNWRTAKKNNLSLQNTLRLLEQSQAENSRVLQIVAHDLRNPITSMFSLASMMLDSPGHSANDRYILENIKISGKNCIDLVSDLLRVNITTGELEKEDIDLEKMLSYCVVQLKNKAEDKAQQLILQTQPCTVPGSPQNLWRVISNLIGNAIKFSPAGAVIHIMLEQTAKWAVISINDNGIGIPNEIKDKLFSMDASIKRTGTAGERSFGMGLSISKQIVEAHGGRLWFESEPGKGATFYVELSNK